MLALILALAMSGTSCAAIDNTSNTAVWVSNGTAGASQYTDTGDRVRYATAPGPTDDGAWVALHAVERALAANPPGHRVRAACL